MNKEKLTANVRATHIGACLALVSFLVAADTAAAQVPEQSAQGTATAAPRSNEVVDQRRAARRDRRAQAWDACIAETRARAIPREARHEAVKACVKTRFR
jgi:hypothetical protein